MTFSLRARHHGHIAWLTPGDAVSLEFDDGKGVSGRIADVDVAPGGSSFTIICTHDGQIDHREEDDNHAANVLATGILDADVVVQGRIVTGLSHPHTSPRDRAEVDGTQLPIPGLVNLETGLVADPDHELQSWKEAHARARKVIEVEREAHQKVTDELNAKISALQSSRSRTTVQAGAVTITVEEN